MLCFHSGISDCGSFSLSGRNVGLLGICLGTGMVVGFTSMQENCCIQSDRSNNCKCMLAVQRRKREKNKKKKKREAPFIICIY